MATTAAKVYTGGNGGWKYTGICGALSVVSDKSGIAFLRVVDLKDQKLLFEQEMYEEFGYDRARDWFHIFEGDTNMHAFSFADTNEALAFYDSVQSVKHQVNSLIAAKRRAPPIAAGRVPPPPPTSTNNPQVVTLKLQNTRNSMHHFNYDTMKIKSMPKIANPFQPGNVAPSNPMHVVSLGLPANWGEEPANFKKKKKAPPPPPQQIEEPTVVVGKDISGPTNVQHIAHVGFTLAGGFQLRDIPNEWKEMFKAAGIKPKDFANPRRATMIMSVIGMANLPEDENTCVPTYNIPTPPSFVPPAPVAFVPPVITPPVIRKLTVKQPLISPSPAPVPRKTPPPVTPRSPALAASVPTRSPTIYQRQSQFTKPSVTEAEIQYDEEAGYYDEEGGYYDAYGGYYDTYGGYYDDQGGYYDIHGGYYDVNGAYYDADGNYFDENGDLVTLLQSEGDKSNSFSSVASDLPPPAPPKAPPLPGTDKTPKPVLKLPPRISVVKPPPRGSVAKPPLRDFVAKPPPPRGSVVKPPPSIPVIKKLSPRDSEFSQARVSEFGMVPRSVSRDTFAVQNTSFYELPRASTQFNSAIDEAESAFDMFVLDDNLNFDRNSTAPSARIPSTRVSATAPRVSFTPAYNKPAPPPPPPSYDSSSGGAAAGGLLAAIQNKKLKAAARESLPPLTTANAGTLTATLSSAINAIRMATRDPDEDEDEEEEEFDEW